MYKNWRVILCLAAVMGLARGEEIIPSANVAEISPPASQEESPAATMATTTPEPLQTLDKPVALDTSRVKNPMLQRHLLDNVDIFGKSNLPAIYIFGPGDFGADEINAQAITRNFAADPFLMQNIDREEFEWRMVLRGLPDEAEKEREAPQP